VTDVSKGKDRITKQREVFTDVFGMMDAAKGINDVSENCEFFSNEFWEIQ
jgi:hypothetical protein